jgi:transposase
LISTFIASRNTAEGNGHSNKEIARELNLSEATVKHHVHNVLDKLHQHGRAQAMRRVRDAPWLVVRSEGSLERKLGDRGHDPTK